MKSIVCLGAIIAFTRNDINNNCRNVLIQRHRRSVYLTSLNVSRKTGNFDTFNYWPSSDEWLITVEICWNVHDFPIYLYVLYVCPYSMLFLGKYCSGYLSLTMIKWVYLFGHGRVSRNTHHRVTLNTLLFLIECVRCECVACIRSPEPNRRAGFALNKYKPNKLRYVVLKHTFMAFN